MLSKFGFKLTKIELELLINQIDEDGNGTVDLPEFVSLMKRKVDMTETEEYKEAFCLFDSKGKG